MALSTSPRRQLREGVGDTVTSLAGWAGKKMFVKIKNSGSELGRLIQ